jgi:hypothetical protein
MPIWARTEHGTPLGAEIPEARGHLAIVPKHLYCGVLYFGASTQLDAELAGMVVKAKTGTAGADC